MKNIRRGTIVMADFKRWAFPLYIGHQKSDVSFELYIVILFVHIGIYGIDMDKADEFIMTADMEMPVM